jgi:outer membrane receptor protein involved in Fe transport
MSKITVFVFLALCVQMLNAQAQNYASVSGFVKDAKNNGILGITVLLEGTQTGAATDELGFFEIKNLLPGNYILVISGIGYKPQKRAIALSPTQGLNLEIVLEEDAQGLDEVIITGKSTAKELSEQPITISSLATRPLLAQAMGAEELLKTTTGVVVRQNGGLGSNFNINLNGLTGQAVRLYFDGIPIEVFGGGISLNTIPIDALERIDVYKGVMPVAVGTDALGGGIDLVPLKKDIDYLSTSYTVGSFNTHRFTFSGNKRLSEKVSLATLAYFNYSDNDYKMRNIRNLTEQTLPNGTVVPGPEEIIEARRFHNRHISGYAEATLRLKQLKWADQLEITALYSQRDDQIQNGAFISNTSVGEATTGARTFAQRLDYRKQLFNDKLSLRYFGVFSTTRNEVNDSTRFFYDWRGNRLQIVNNVGSELFARPTSRVGNDIGTAHRLMATYKILPSIDFTVSEFFGYVQIKGEDPIGPRLSINGEPIDPNTIPSSLTRNIAGAELKGSFLDNRLVPVLFYKNYFYNSEAIDILAVNSTQIPVRTVRASENGYGLALKYQFFPSFFVRTSFERAVRIPTEREIFGDFAAIRPNFELRPEKSNNVNLGVQFEPELDSYRSLFIGVDGFIRNQEDLIRPEPFGFENIILSMKPLLEGTA